MLSFSKRFLFLLAMCLGLNSLLPAGDPINKKKGLALKGYDAVSYFQSARPVKGDPKYTHAWMGARWQFSTAENRDAFAADPEKYAPQFGGYCAWAASQGYLYDANPQYWRIVDGKLYLNYNGSAQRKWERDTAGNIAQAEKNWPGLIQ